MMLLEQMMQTERLVEFIDELDQIMWQEKANEQRWDFWVHRVFDMDFAEYVQLCEDNMKQKQSSEKNDIEATVKYSYEMMENFHP